MRRRDFIAGIAGSAATWPLAAHAQQARKLPTIGFLGTTSPAAWGQAVVAFEQRLNELGWVKGRTIDVDYRWTEGREEPVLEIVEEFVRRKVDVIVVGGNAVSVAKRATASIPIVFPVAVDPLGSGFVDNLSRPGGNVTGLSLQAPDLAGKRIELLIKLVPGFRRLAIMVNVSYAASKNEIAECQKAARSFGLEATVLELRHPEDIGAAFDGLQGRADALYVVPDALTTTYQTRIATLALRARLPTIMGASGIARGGLMGYGASLPALFRRTGDYVDKILRGTKPGEIPVEQPTKFVFTINLTIAKALGLTVPPTLLALADEVIE
jgi:putative ABC transport system substrate-binding protein